MKNTTIYFIRHGAVDNPKNVYYGRTIDVPLTDGGKEFILCIAEKIKSKDKIDAIYSSPLRRAFDSAKIIASINNCEVIKEEDLIEVDIPALVGHPLSEQYELHSKGIDEYNEEFIKKGNESREYVAERMLRVFNKIYDKDKSKNIVMVSHGDPLCFLYFRLTKPDENIPPVAGHGKSYYPQKGEGWKMIFDDNKKILETEFITGNV